LLTRRGVRWSEVLDSSTMVVIMVMSTGTEDEGGCGEAEGCLMDALHAHRITDNENDSRYRVARTARRTSRWPSPPSR